MSKFVAEGSGALLTIVWVLLKWLLLTFSSLRSHFDFVRPIVDFVRPVVLRLLSLLRRCRRQGCWLCHCEYSFWIGLFGPYSNCHPQNYDFPNNCEDYVHRIGRTGVRLLYSIFYSLVANVRLCSAPVARGLHLRTLRPKTPRLLPSSWRSLQTPSRSFPLNSKKWHGLVEAVVGIVVMVAAEEAAEAGVVGVAVGVAVEGMVVVVGVADMVVVAVAGTVAVAVGVADGKPTLGCC